MKLTRVFKKSYTIGLDIGAGAIKLAQFRKDENSLSLVKLKIIELDKDRETLSALKEILSNGDIKNSQVITLVNSPQTMVRMVTVPQMPQSELKEAISLEAKNYFPFPVGDSLIDFEVVGDTLEKSIKKLELLVAVCPKKALKEHMDLLSEAGIRPFWVIHPSLALYNLLKLSKEARIGECIVAVDIGKKSCELIVVKDKHLAFSRKLPVSGDDFTKAITATLVSGSGRVQLSYEDAEKIKRVYGIPEEGAQGLIGNKLAASQLLSMIRPPAEKLSREIAHSFDFYREGASAGRIDRLILFGGGGRLKGLDKFLSQELGMEVEIYDSLEGINTVRTLAKDVDINRIAGAVGAGINRASGINLLPSEIKEERKRRVQGMVLKAASSAALTLMVLAYLGMRIQFSTLDKKIASAKYELSALRVRAEDAQGRLLTNKIIQDEPYWEDALREITNIIPSDIYLKEMKFGNGLLTMRGVILSLKNPEEAVSNFIRQLETGIFKNAKLVITHERDGVNEFELQMEVE